MGTYLTALGNDSLMEKLAGVPAGTFARYRELCAPMENGIFPPEIMADPEVHQTGSFNEHRAYNLVMEKEGASMDALLLFLDEGLGRMKEKAYNYLWEEGVYDDRVTTDRKVMETLLEKQGVWMSPEKLEQLEGLQW